MFALHQGIPLAVASRVKTEMLRSLILFKGNQNYAGCWEEILSSLITPAIFLVILAEFAQPLPI